MPFDFSWQDEDHSIIRFDIHGVVSWELWHEAIDKVAAELAKTSHRIDLMFVDTVGMPSGNPIRHIKAGTSELLAYPNMGMVITVSTHKISVGGQLMIDIMMRVYRMDMKHHGGFVDTIDDALAVIAQDRIARKRGE